MDHNRVCMEYWDSRPYSRAQMQIRQPSQNGSNLNRASGEENNRDSPGSHLLPGADLILRGLFKKATPAELHSLYSILNDNRPAADRFLVTRLLGEEILNRPWWFIISDQNHTMAVLTCVNSPVLAFTLHMHPQFSFIIFFSFFFS